MRQLLLGKGVVGFDLTQCFLGKVYIFSHIDATLFHVLLL